MIKSIQILTLISCLLWVACANVVTPTGGDKDVIPPKLVKRNIPDSALQFTGGKIQFEFDEYIQLKDIQNQLVISPLMKTKPKVTSNKKTLKIEIPDSLLERNTTYRINFGNAVQDLHEGNPYSNLSYTFSTGPYFDSLSLQGELIEAQSGQPDTSVWVLLYPTTWADSAFQYQKPMYIQKSTMGRFSFANLPNRTFNIYALQDINTNLYYDQPSERIAFLAKPVTPQDSNSQITLYTFQEKLNSDSTLKRLSRKNTPTNEKMSKLSYRVNVETTKKNTRTFDINDSIIITFSQPIKTIDERKIRLYQNEILDAAVEIKLDSTNQQLVVNTDWSMDANYSLKLLKGFAIDSSNVKSDSSQISFKTKRSSDYGFASLITEKDPTHWLELFKDNQVIARKNATDTLVVFGLLNPGSYKVRILHDENSNGKWDTGDYKTRKQPEIVEAFEQEILIKANWENKLMLVKKAPRNRK